MANSPLLVGQISNLPVPGSVLDSALVRVVELAATYLVHSTLFLVVGWALLPVLLRLFRERRPDGQECPSYAPAVTERVWKLAAVLALVTAPLSVLTGWSRPAFEWSWREWPAQNVVVVSVEAERLEPAVVTEPLAPAGVEEPLRLPDEQAAFTEALPVEIPFALPADTPIAAAPTADSIPFTSDSPLRMDDVPKQPIPEALLTDSSAIAPAHVEALARHGSPEIEPTRAGVRGLGIALVVWMALSVMRVVMKGVALHRRLVACQLVQGDLQRMLNRFLAPGHSVRLLVAAVVGDRRNGTDETNGTDVETHATNESESSSKNGIASVGLVPPLASASVAFVPSLPTRLPTRQPTTIAGPFACGLFRWTIVLPAGIEQRLSASELKALLAHEVAHLVRRDPWWLWLGEVLCTCLAFQPLNFLARRRWQQTAELLCDDWAVERHVSATSLASCLTKLAEWRLDRRTAVMGLTAVGRSGSLTQRIEWLLRNGRASEPKRPRARMATTLMTFSLGLLVGLYGPRLTLIVPVAASDAQAASPDETVLNETAFNEVWLAGRNLTDSSDDDALAARLWDDIEFDLHQTLIELARLESRLITDPDPAVASLANRLRARAASLQERVAP